MGLVASFAHAPALRLLEIDGHQHAGELRHRIRLCKEQVPVPRLDAGARVPVIAEPAAEAEQITWSQAKKIFAWLANNSVANNCFCSANPWRESRISFPGSSGRS